MTLWGIVNGEFRILLKEMEGSDNRLPIKCIPKCRYFPSADLLYYFINFRAAPWKRFTHTREASIDIYKYSK